MINLSIAFGHNDFITWISTVAWCLLGILGTKVYFYIVRTANRDKPFNLKFWWKDNAADFMVGFVLSLFLLRGGDEIIYYLESSGYKLPFNIQENADVVVLYSAISAVFQGYLHKKKKVIQDKLKINDR